MIFFLKETLIELHPIFQDNLLHLFDNFFKLLTKWIHSGCRLSELELSLLSQRDMYLKRQCDESLPNRV